MTRKDEMNRRPRLQVIRGLPGSGKSTLAKKFDCIHLEVDQFCINGGKYVFELKHETHLMQFCNRVFELDTDLVVCGVLPNFDMSEKGVWPMFARLLRYAFSWSHEGYEVYIHDQLGEYGNQHGCDVETLRRMKAAWKPWSILRNEVPVEIAEAAKERKSVIQEGLMPFKAIPTSSKSTPTNHFI